MSPSQVRASHILLMYAGSMRSSASRSKDDAKTLIESLKGEIDGGADFAELARKHSDCPSGQEGGDLGAFPRGAMVPEFEKAAFALEPGQTSDVVETAFGYHLIQRTA
ncbi:MAG: peptidyl-prolyl cis-trans isomerase [Caenispirillum bisanense]|nr:peptidyl-prolyl cis-trans isomerase [Caenispirillum bisanense]MCA1972031.1 peptidyl-prolyl cis-trans isomerase [Caenispirillum sp.]